jgi:aldose 1-epimerase
MIDMSNFSYQVTSNDENFPVYILSDGQGSEVEVAPAAGFNAYAFRVPYRDSTLQILCEPKDRTELQAGGFMFGLPVLFPFPNRVRDGRYQFEGKEYNLDINAADGNAIHGLVANRPWEVVEADATAERGAFVSAVFDTSLHPEVLRQYPFPCILKVTYQLHNRALTMDISVENTGSTNLPMGFGIHPWFPVHLLPKENGPIAS